MRRISQEKNKEAGLYDNRERYDILPGASLHYLLFNVLFSIAPIATSAAVRLNSFSVYRGADNREKYKENIFTLWRCTRHCFVLMCGNALSRDDSFERRKARKNK